MQFIQHEQVRAVDAIGTVTSIAWRKLDKDGQSIYQLFPNGNTCFVKNKYGTQNHYIVAIAETPEQAWEKAKANKELMQEFGIVVST